MLSETCDVFFGAGSPGRNLKRARLEAPPAHAFKQCAAEVSLPSLLQEAFQPPQEMHMLPSPWTTSNPAQKEERSVPSSLMPSQLAPGRPAPPPCSSAPLCCSSLQELETHNVPSQTPPNMQQQLDYFRADGLALPEEQLHEREQPTTTPILPQLLSPTFSAEADGDTPCADGDPPCAADVQPHSPLATGLQPAGPDSVATLPEAAHVSSGCACDGDAVSFSYAGAPAVMTMPASRNISASATSTATPSTSAHGASGCACDGVSVSLAEASAPMAMPASNTVSAAVAPVAMPMSTDCVDIDAWKRANDILGGSAAGPQADLASVKSVMDDVLDAVARACADEVHTAEANPKLSLEHLREVCSVDFPTAALGNPVHPSCSILSYVATDPIRVSANVEGDQALDLQYQSREIACIVFSTTSVPR